MDNPDLLLETLNRIRSPILIGLNEASRELSLNDATSIKSLALIRWELMRHLRAYQLYKHTRIFDPIIRAAIPCKAGLAKEMKNRCLVMAHDYEAHVAKWSLSGPASAWTSYVAEAQAMSQRIARHLSQEEQQMSDLLALPTGRR